MPNFARPNFQGRQFQFQGRQYQARPDFGRRGLAFVGRSPGGNRFIARRAGPQGIVQQRAFRGDLGRIAGPRNARFGNRALTARQATGSIRGVSRQFDRGAITGQRFDRRGVAFREDAARSFVGSRQAAALRFSHGRHAFSHGRHAAFASWGRKPIALSHHKFHPKLTFPRRAFLIGWAGPVFWPYVYDDVFYYTFWPYPNDEPFWGYGYTEIWNGIFSPESYAVYPRSGTRVATRRGRVGDDAIATGSLPQEELARMCGEDARDIVTWPIENIVDIVKPTPEQRAVLDELANAAVKAAQIVREACPREVALTPSGRLTAMVQRLSAIADAIALVREPLERFYGLLDDEQKARLNEIAERMGPEDRRAVLARPCGDVPRGVGQWPTAEIERALSPTPEQRERLAELIETSDEAANMIKATCPSVLPLTPTARLEAAAKRVDTMLAAARSVSSALNAFYDSLSDEQKARFNAIGRTRPRTAERR